MSKQVKATSNPVTLNSGESVIMGSDGNVYRSNSHIKGEVLVGDDDSEDCEVAFTRAGVALMKRKMPALQEIADLLKKVEKLKSKFGDHLDKYSPNFESEFTDKNESDEEVGFGLRVGCTNIPIEELAGVMKELGI